MNESRNVALIVALALGVWGAIAVAVGAALGPFHANPTKGSAELAAAAVGVVAYFAGRRISNVYLVGVGLLLLVDAFMGLTRGVFYLDFAALNGKVVPLVWPDRGLASLPHLIVGALAFYAGLAFANRDARARPSPDL